MSTVVEIEEAVSKLPPEDFERLMEDLRDLQMARNALAEIEAGREETIPWNILKAELDAIHG